MTKLLAALLPAAIAATASAASAQTYVASDAPTYARSPLHTQLGGRVGLLLGGSDVGDADGFSAGISGALGYRIGDVTIRGLVDYYRVGDGGGEAMDRKGRATRLGGALRYSFAHTTYDSDFAADLWGELGVGYEHVAWREGGVLDRPSGELAIGYDIGGRTRADNSGRRRTLGYFMDFRTLLAHGPELPGVMATCGGPCDQATKPSRTDISMFFELGVHWGR